MDLIGGAKREILHLQAERNFMNGNFRTALQEFKQLFEIELETGKDEDLAYLDDRIGECYDKLDHHGHKERVEDHKKAAEHYIKAADRYRKLKKYDQAGIVYEKGAKAFEEFDDLKETAEFYRESGNMFKEVGDFVNASYAFFSAAERFEKEGLADKAALTYKESAVSNLRIKDTSNASNGFKKAAANYMKVREWDKALDSLAASVGIDTIGRQYLEVAETYERMGDVYYEIGDSKNAVYYHLKSADLRIANEDRKGAALNYRQVGSVYDRDKNYDKAIEYFTLSAKTYYAANQPCQEALSYTKAAEVYETKGEYESAGNCHLEAGESSRNGDNQALAKDEFIKAAQDYTKATDGLDDKVKSSLLFLKAAEAYSEIEDYDKSADSYNKHAKLLYEAGEVKDAEEGFKKAAREYVKGGRLWDAAEAYVNHEAYQSACELYEKYALQSEGTKDNYGTAIGQMEAANCYRRLGRESLLKSRLEKALLHFSKFSESLREKILGEERNKVETQAPDLRNNIILLGDAFRKMGECELRLDEYNKAQLHFQLATEQYSKAGDKNRESVGNAFQLLVDGVKAIDHGYYPNAEELLSKSHLIFDEAQKSQEWKREYTKILNEHADETQELIEKIKLKPEVMLDMDGRSYTFVNIPAIVNVRLSNNGKYTMKEITFLEHLPEQIRLTKLPDPIPAIDPGTVVKTSVEFTPNTTGFYRLKPLEVYYEDQKAHKYVKASSEINLEVVEYPPTDFKSYNKAVDIFHEYARSQETNQNWFPAGDGFREMAEVYGRFRTDETLKEYWGKAVENYRRYVKAAEGTPLENKTHAKRVADAHWFIGEGCRNLEIFDEAIQSYDKSVVPYRGAAMNTLASRSMAFKLKTEGTKAIKLGDYGLAESKLNESLTYFDDVMKTGGLDEENLKYVEKNEDEVKKMLETLKSKPDIVVSVACEGTARIGEDILFKATITNPLGYAVKAVKPAPKTADRMELTEKAQAVGEVAAGATVQLQFMMRPNAKGEYRFKPLDVLYQDDKGNAYMKGSNEVSIMVTGEAQGKDAKPAGKADVALEIDMRSYTFTDIPVILNVSLTNNGSYQLRNVTFLEHLPEGIKLTRLPTNLPTLEKGQTNKSSVELTPKKTGVYRVKPIELYFEDPGGNRYVKSCNETVVEVVEKPASDFKNYMTAVEVFLKYAHSQQGNQNWFQAGDGFREMAEVYGRFRTDETLKEYWKSAVDNYQRYLGEAPEEGDAEDNTKKKRRGDANWYVGEGLRNMGLYEQAAQAYGESAKHYAECQADNLVRRSNAMRYKTAAVRAIKAGDYPTAEDMIKESLRFFDEAYKSGGFETDELDFLKRNEDEVKKFLENIKTKPEIGVLVEGPTSASEGDTVEFQATVANPLKTAITQLRPIVKGAEGMELVEAPNPVNALNPQEKTVFKFRLKVKRSGEYRYPPFDIAYKDDQGKEYMKGGNEIWLKVPAKAAATQAREAPQAKPKEAEAEAPPVVSLRFEIPRNIPVGQAFEISGTLSNDGKMDVQGLRFMANRFDGIEVTNEPGPVEALAAGAKKEVKAKITVSKEGAHKARLFELFYKNPQGRRFFKSSEEQTFNAGK